MEPRRIDRILTSVSTPVGSVWLHFRVPVLGTPTGGCVLSPNGRHDRRDRTAPGSSTEDSSRLHASATGREVFHV